MSDKWRWRIVHVPVRIGFLSASPPPALCVTRHRPPPCPRSIACCRPALGGLGRWRRRRDRRDDALHERVPHESGQATGALGSRRLGRRCPGQPRVRRHVLQRHTLRGRGRGRARCRAGWSARHGHRDVCSAGVGTHACGVRHQQLAEQVLGQVAQRTPSRLRLLIPRLQDARVVLRRTAKRGKRRLCGRGGAGQVAGLASCAPQRRSGIEVIRT